MVHRARVAYSTTLSAFVTYLSACDVKCLRRHAFYFPASPPVLLSLLTPCHSSPLPPTLFHRITFLSFLLFLFPLYCTTSLSYIPFPIYANNTTRLALLLPLPHVSTAQPKSVLTSIIASSTALFSFAIQPRHDRRRTCQRFI